ncbi:hypothetical protein [Nonomuraea soli]|uniref:Conjugal transfer protein TraI n=1 Tax=Nonomuraea soli TaxID=1032476 RepID=A0A7W0CSR4_9ACTN|nr:hypothetical protein [Nonomuraea soli]MBA2896644.1 hypothetical protein [Nonomuraea soli]
MTVNLPDPSPEPTPEEIARGLADLERHLSANQPVPRAMPVTAFGSAHRRESRRVRKLRAEVAEARTLADLQGDDAPLLLDTPKVRKRRKAARQAARLHALAHDPDMRAWQAARMRRTLVTAALVSLTLALAWSTAGVQTFAADGAAAWSPGWVFAWLVEPFLSLALLVVVGARAYLGTCGQPVADRALVRIEWLFLALTLGMNAWPYLPGVADTFSLSRLVLHILGPIVAVAIVTALPIILAAFARLDHGMPGTPTGPTGPTYRANAAVLAALTARARHLIDAGELPADPGADKIRRALGCGMDSARAVRDALRFDTPSPS